MVFTQIDVSELAPPAPMAVILSALAELVNNSSADKHCLVVRHRRQPFPLYEKLNATGWAYHCQIRTNDDILLYIYRQTAQQAFEHYLANSLLPNTVGTNE